MKATARSFCTVACVALCSGWLLAAEPLHPAVVLRDEQGRNVLDTGRAVSPLHTCGSCHDTEYIESHCYHATLGIDQLDRFETSEKLHPWDYAPAGPGSWNPLRYRYLAPPESEPRDLGLADWIRTFGWRHVGGGIAETGFGRQPLGGPQSGSIASGQPLSVIDSVLDPATGQRQPWDWKASGTVELNCFLCHLGKPDNQARIVELREGRFRWAATATLQSLGIVSQQKDSRWEYHREAFDPNGAVPATELQLGPPTSTHCGLCHGQVHFSEKPLTLQLDLHNWSTATKGQVFSPQRISDSAVNLRNRDQLARPWDVHAEALLECRNCHFSLDHPAEFRAAPGRPQHLRYDPRRLEFAEYLHRPSHDLAKGRTVQGRIAPHLAGSMRTCTDCHDAGTTHDWLPYRRVHFDRLACEACHIPQTYAPAIRSIDWTLLRPDGTPRVEWRGIEGSVDDPAAFVTGFRPVLLPRTEQGKLKWGPYNLVAAAYWVDGTAHPTPVPLHQLKAALLHDGRYHSAIRQVLDTNGDGAVSGNELLLDTPEKLAAVKGRLQAVGVENPQLVSQVQAYGLHHGVGPGRSAIRRCEECHNPRGRFGTPVLLAQRFPAGTAPNWISAKRLPQTLQWKRQPEGGLLARWEPGSTTIHVLGRHRAGVIDALGSLLLAVAVVGVGIHTALRLYRAQAAGGAGEDSTRQPTGTTP